MKTILKVLFGLFLMSSVGCASVSSMRNEPLTDGVNESFPGNLERVVSAVKASIPECGLHLAEESKTDSGAVMIIAQSDVSGFSWGDVLRVVIAPDGSSRSRVWVMNSHKYMEQRTSNVDHSAMIFSKLIIKLTM